MQTVSRREARGTADQARQDKSSRRQPLVREVERLERRLAEWQAEKRELDEQLADPAFYASPEVDQMKGLVLRQQEVTRLIDEAEHRWLEVHAALEEIGEV